MSEGKKLQADLTKDCDFHMPQTYQPGGGPHYWMQEASGILRAAVEAFVDPEQTLETRQFELLKQYIVHWINAPCWRWDPKWLPREYFGGRVEQAKTRDELWRVLHLLNDETCIDPL